MQLQTLQMEKVWQEHRAVRCTTSINFRKTECLNHLYSFEQLSSNICTKEMRRLELLFDTNYILLFEMPGKFILIDVGTSAGW